MFKQVTYESLNIQKVPQKPICFYQMLLKQLDIYKEIKEAWPLLHSVSKNSPEWVNDLNTSKKSIKFKK